MTDGEAMLEGGCSCGHVRFKMKSLPMIVHACHCSWCQRQTGTAFATNALIEADRVEVLQGDVRHTTVPSPAGAGQRFARCPKCDIAVWSEYLVMTRGITDLVWFIRVGTLDEPAKLPPDVHIYTSTKVPWIVFPDGAHVVEEYYDTEQTWSPESLTRLKALSVRIAELKE